MHTLRTTSIMAEKSVVVHTWNQATLGTVPLWTRHQYRKKRSIRISGHTRFAHFADGKVAASMPRPGTKKNTPNPVSDRAGLKHPATRNSLSSIPLDYYGGVGGKGVCNPRLLWFAGWGS